MPALPARRQHTVNVDHDCPFCGAAVVATTTVWQDGDGWVVDDGDPVGCKLRLTLG